MITKVYINKAEAARRQVNAAIRMHFLGIDELAVQTVIGAARNIVRDLHKVRGLDVAEFTLRCALVFSVQAYCKGELQDPQLREIAADILDNITESEKNWMLSQDPYSPEIAIETGTAKSLMTRSARVINFLKHADRDHDQLLDSAYIDNVQRITEASAWYSHLGFDATVEIRVFNL